MIEACHELVELLDLKLRRLPLRISADSHAEF